MLESLLFSPVLEWAVDDSGFDGTTEQRGKTGVRAAGDRLHGNVFIGIQAISAKQLVDREVRRAAEAIDSNPFSFKRFDAVDLRSRHDGIAARLGGRCNDFYRQGTGGGHRKKTQDAELITPTCTET